MARGLEVLKGALSGKRARCPILAEGIWLYWDADIKGFRSVEGTPRAVSFRDLFVYPWEIEPDAPLSFTEAVAAMDAGHVVQRPSGDNWLWRKDPEGSFYQCADPSEGDNWGGGDSSTPTSTPPTGGLCRRNHRMIAPRYAKR